MSVKEYFQRVFFSMKLFARAVFDVIRFLIKDKYRKECHRLEENIIRLQYDAQIAKYKNQR